jgi:hypothetical protein
LPKSERYYTYLRQRRCVDCAAKAVKGQTRCPRHAKAHRLAEKTRSRLTRERTESNIVGAEGSDERTD